MLYLLLPIFFILEFGMILTMSSLKYQQISLCFGYWYSLADCWVGSIHCTWTSFLFQSPKQRLETYCFCSVSYYYFYYYNNYVIPNAVGWRIAILRFFFTIIILIIILILPHIFVRSISRRCLDQTLWNRVGISYAMWSCAGKMLKNLKTQKWS